MRRYRLHRICAGVAGVILAQAAAGGALAQADGPPLSDCFDAVGTFLTINDADGEVDDFVSRSLISLTNGGHAFFTDSGEDGGPGFGPFSEGRGAWRCLANTDGVVRLRAVIVDFTFIDPENQTRQIGRLDIEGSFETRTDSLSGKLSLSFAAFDGNPMKPEELRKVAEAAFTGYKITAE